MASGKIARLVVLNDESTFSDIEGCRIVEVLIPHNVKDANDFIEDALSEGTVESSRDVDAPFVLAVGNAFDGIRIVGPFASQEEASEVGRGFSDMDWHIVKIENP